MTTQTQERTHTTVPVQAGDVVFDIYVPIGQEPKLGDSFTMYVTKGSVHLNKRSKNPYYQVMANSTSGVKGAPFGAIGDQRWLEVLSTSVTHEQGNRIVFQVEVVTREVSVEQLAEMPVYDASKATSDFARPE